MGPEKRIKLAICLVLFFLGTGTVGYSYIDGYSLLDAFYMTVITLTTVGYGEIQQLSEAGRVFTIFLILFGVGSIAFAAGAFTELIIERSANPNRRLRFQRRAVEIKTQFRSGCGGYQRQVFDPPEVDALVIARTRHDEVAVAVGEDRLANDLEDVVQRIEDHDVAGAVG